MDVATHRENQVEDFFFFFNEWVLKLEWRSFWQDKPEDTFLRSKHANVLEWSSQCPTKSDSESWKPIWTLSVHPVWLSPKLVYGDKCEETVEQMGD